VADRKDGSAGFWGSTPVTVAMKVNAVVAGSNVPSTVS
jgi:hypothetical protein